MALCLVKHRDNLTLPYLTLPLPNKLYPALRLMNFISAVFSLLISLCFTVQISQLYKGDRMAQILYTRTFNRHCLWTKFGFKTLFKIPTICKNLLLFEIMSFSSPYGIWHQKYVNVLRPTCSNLQTQCQPWFVLVHSRTLFQLRRFYSMERKDYEGWIGKDVERSGRGLLVWKD
jgi:hypothetical protein